MGRTVSTALQNLLDLAGCETQTTLDIVPVSGSPIYQATKALTANSHTYTDDLRGTGEIKQSVFAPPDRVTAQIQNVDKAFGPTVTGEGLAKAQAIVGRYFTDPSGVLPSVWVELFRGQLKQTGLDEGLAAGEILDDLAAAGYCVAHWSLAPNCQNVFKNASTCGYAGALTTCNKRRKSPDGCSGRINSGTVTNEHRFNGMEFPDAQGPELPKLSGPTPGGWPVCPREDQFVLARSEWTPEPRPKQVKMLGTKDELYDPITGEFVAIRSITIIPNEPIWAILTANGGQGRSSGTHPIIRDASDDKGTPVNRLRPGDPVLTYSKGDLVKTAGRALSTGEKGRVVKIELASGHIYAYSDRSGGPFIVCHNSKPPTEP